MWQGLLCVSEGGLRARTSTVSLGLQGGISQRGDLRARDDLALGALRVWKIKRKLQRMRLTVFGQGVS